MSLRGALALIGLMLFIAANGTPAAAGRTSPPPVTVAAGPPAPAVQMQAEQEDDAEPTAQPDAAPSDGDGIPVAPLLTPDGRLQLDGTVQGPLDLDGWQVTLDPDDGPVFRPEAVSGTWSHLGERALRALNGTVYAVVISGTEVLVGGDFTNAGGVAGANKVARWDGSQWRTLGAPFSFSPFPFSDVYTLALSGTEVLAGGSFTNAGGVSGANYVAKLSGNTWGALGPTNSINGTVRTLVVTGTTTKEVLAGGFFTDAGGNPNADYLARLSGGSWGALGTTPLNGAVYALAVGSAGVFAGGAFVDAGGVTEADYVARWDGSQWRALGGSGGVGAFAPVGGSFPVVSSLAVSGNNLYVGGFFQDVAGVAAADYLARWDGSTWSDVGGSGSLSALNSTVEAIAVGANNDLSIGGWFTNAAGNNLADYIVRYQPPYVVYLPLTVR